MQSANVCMHTRTITTHTCTDCTRACATRVCGAHMCSAHTRPLPWCRHHTHVQSCTHMHMPTLHTHTCACLRAQAYRRTHKCPRTYRSTHMQANFRAHTHTITAQMCSTHTHVTARATHMCALRSAHAPTCTVHTANIASSSLQPSVSTASQDVQPRGGGLLLRAHLLVLPHVPRADMRQGPHKIHSSSSSIFLLRACMTHNRNSRLIYYLFTPYAQSCRCRQLQLRYWHMPVSRR